MLAILKGLYTAYLVNNDLFIPFILLAFSTYSCPQKVFENLPNSRYCSRNLGYKKAKKKEEKKQREEKEGGEKRKRRGRRKEEEEN